MSQHSGWTQLRNVTTVLSLVNATSVFVEKTVAGSSRMPAMLQNHDVRIRLWATAVLLFGAGALTLISLIVSTRDAATDLQPGAARQRVVMLGFLVGQFVIAGALLTLLLVYR